MRNGASGKDILECQGSFDVVIADRYLGTLPEETAKRTLEHVCGLVKAGGVILIHDVAALPPSLLAGLVQCAFALLQQTFGALLGAEPGRGAPVDLAALLPRDTGVEARLAASPIHEALTVRKHAAAPDAVVERLRRLYGNTSMAYCTSPEANRIGGAEQSIRYFVAAAEGDGEASREIGYVAYMEHLIMGARLRLALMDPVCAPEDRLATLQGFLDDCRAVQARPIFACVSSEWTAPLRQLGLNTTMLGGEVGIPLAQHTLSKDRRRYLRAAPAKGLECHTECYDLEELEELNAAWVGSKASGTEVLVWTWPPSMPEDEAGGEAEVKADEVRRLFCYQDGKLVGFVCAEPYYRGDGSREISGYGLNTIRFLPNLSPPWISDFTVASLIQALQSEGRAEHLAFGLSPFSEVVPHPGETSWLRCIHQFAWTANLESVYSIQGLAKKKAHHCAGQGVRLHDRFIGGYGAYAVGDAARFMTLLFGDSLSKLPEIVAVLAGQLAGAAAGRAGQLAKRIACGARGLVASDGGRPARGRASKGLRQDPAESVARSSAGSRVASVLPALRRAGWRAAALL